jgi:hypothetical protein
MNLVQCRYRFQAIWSNNISLFDDIVSNTARNFRELATGQHGFGYEGCIGSFQTCAPIYISCCSFVDRYHPSFVVHVAGWRISNYDIPNTVYCLWLTRARSFFDNIFETVLRDDGLDTMARWSACRLRGGGRGNGCRPRDRTGWDRKWQANIESRDHFVWHRRG